ncbi:MAG TPA: pyridoxal-dependent decarboxylase [Terriglobales bacterium]|nr:pyridoxal-dependent decarboxylase [Terriglobales bacterium]
MPNTENRAAIEHAWDRAKLRRLGRAFSDWAADELTHSGRGPVRPPDFHARARALTRVKGGAASTPAWLRQLGAAGMHINHPAFMAQQVAAPIPLAAMIESAVATLNQSIAVWEMSPAAMLIDRQVLDRCKKLFGYPASAEGSLTPGGSFANLTAMLAARAALAPKAWQSGAPNRIAILAGAQTHYSIARAAGIMGMGAQCVFAIPTDAAHRTDTGAIPEAARRARRAGYRRFILVATCGSTPTGSLDDLEGFANAARGLDAWFHIDAAHGGGLMFSPRLRRRLRGIAAADSIAFDPHKMMFMPLAAGAVLVRHGSQLTGAFEQHAPYLFHPPSEAPRAVADVGPFTLACSQRFDALKIWMVWNAYGPGLFAALADATCATARAAFDYCRRSKLLAPLHQPDSNILCFGLRQPVANADHTHWVIKEAVNATGRAYISSTVLEGRRCFRVVIMNPRSTEEHVKRVLGTVEREARRALGGERKK